MIFSGSSGRAKKMYGVSPLSKWYTTEDAKKMVNCMVAQTNDLWAAELTHVGFYTVRAELNDRWHKIVYRTLCDVVKYSGGMHIP